MATDYVKKVEELTTTQLKKSVQGLTITEVSNLVRVYYQMQDERIRGDARARELKKAEGEEPLLLKFLADQSRISEQVVKAAITAFTANHPIGSKLTEIYGIGPVIAAGVISEIDMDMCPTAGHIESFAGFNPNQKWEKGQKRPYNAQLKQVFYQAGASFVKFSGRRQCIYGQVYRERVAWEIEKNERGDNAAYAAANIGRFNKSTESYKAMLEGKISNSHIFARARRIAIKIFINHMFEWWYEHEYGKKAPEPYAFAILQHAHKIPNQFFEPEKAQAWADHVYDTIQLSKEAEEADETLDD